MTLQNHAGDKLRSVKRGGKLFLFKVKKCGAGSTSTVTQLSGFQGQSTPPTAVFTGDGVAMRASWIFPRKPERKVAAYLYPWLPTQLPCKKHPPCSSSHLMRGLSLWDASFLFSFCHLPGQAETCLLGETSDLPSAWL